MAERLLRLCNNVHTCSFLISASFDCEGGTISLQTFTSIYAHSYSDISPRGSVGIHRISEYAELPRNSMARILSFRSMVPESSRTGFLWMLLHLKISQNGVPEQSSRTLLNSLKVIINQFPDHVHHLSPRNLVKKQIYHAQITFIIVLFIM